jgi:endonuclease/exonuclease/phosphatase (EEP) superfamily protein YafD
VRRRQRSVTRWLGVWLVAALAVLLAPFSLYLVVIDSLRLPLLLLGLALLARLLWQKLWWRSMAVVLAALALLAPWLSSGSTPIPGDMQQIKLIVLPSSDPAALSYAVAEKPDLIFIPDFSEETDRALGKQKAILPDPAQRPEVGAALPELTGDYRPWILKTSDGMAIFMRAGLGNADDLRIREARVGSNALVVDAKLAGIDLTLATVHFTRPFPINQFGRQVLEVERLSAQLGAIPRPIILAGDFNALPWSGILAELSEAIGATGAQWTGTFPAWSLLKLPIDQVRVSGGLQIVSLEAGPFVGSIHLPLVAVIALPPR